MLKPLLMTLMMPVLAQASPTLTPPIDLDVKRYAGQWYDVASTQPVFQRNCVCSQVQYELLDSGNISVDNSCRTGEPQGPVNAISGEAVPSSFPGVFKVGFGDFGNLIPNYTVVDVAADYSWAVVSSPVRWPIWILSRTQSLPIEKINEIKYNIGRKGYLTNFIKLNDQENCEDRKSILDIALADERFSTLVTALKAADLADTIGTAEALTVFAPTNEAFAKLPKETLAALLNDKEALTKVLLYHVANGRKDLTALASKGEQVTLNSKAVEFSNFDDKFFVNDSEILIPNIAAANGIIHVIDTVLIP